MADSPYILTATSQNFHTHVLQASFERPILVDFWADWCAPCRMLMPILARLADAYQGRFLLAKVNTEEEQALAAQFGIRSLPTVQLFRDGQAIDQFMGALPEAQIREFLERHLPRPADRWLEQAREALFDGDPTRAGACIDRARASDPDHPRLAIVEIAYLAAQGDLAAARTAIEHLPIELATDPEVVALRGQLQFAAIAHAAPPEPDLRDRLARNARDSEARYGLAARLVTHGDYEEALELLLELLRTDRGFQDDAGRKGMLAIFELLGSSDELVSRYRARMMNALY